MRNQQWNPDRTKPNRKSHAYALVQSLNRPAHDDIRAELVERRYYVHDFDLSGRGGLGLLSRLGLGCGGGRGSSSLRLGCLGGRGGCSETY